VAEFASGAKRRASRLKKRFNRFPKDMKTLLAFLVSFALTTFALFAADPAPTARELASRLSAQREDQSSEVRLRMEIQQPSGTKKASFQIRILERRSASAADVAYVVLWPKERKGEALLVRQAAGQPAKASYLAPGSGSPKPVALSQAVFGSDLTVADTIENFFAWKNQAIVGAEVVDRVDCQILESKPGGGDGSIYTRVRSWIDTRRMVPLRVEKYLSSSAKPSQVIETTRVVPQGSHGNLPAGLSIRSAGKNSQTELDGSQIRWDVKFSDRDFTPEALAAPVVR
jgi:Outer membrane lipoprotein-sorting protein